MATVAFPTPTLAEEFQSLLEILRNGHTLTCHGMTDANRRCGNPVNQKAKQRLLALCTDVITCLENGCNGIEVLLQEASYLSMCVRWHQFQAADRYETWMTVMPLATDKPSLDDIKTKSVRPPPAASPQDIQTSGDTETVAGSSATSTPISRPTSPTNSLEDSGYISADDDTPSQSVAEKRAVQDSLTPKNPPDITQDKPPPQTPDRPPPLTFDSGISMTIGTSYNAQNEDAEPVSPLAYTAKERNLPGRHDKSPKQAATPIRRTLLQNVKYLGIKHAKPALKLFHDPTKKLATFLRTPFQTLALEMGYIYVFQDKKYNRNKIGCANLRKNASSLEDSFKERIKEHERCGWEPQVVSKFEVAHAQRLERIIHLHLAKEREIETNLSNTKCSHTQHQEWFNKPLHEIVEIIKAWESWMKTEPYVERNGSFVLRTEWWERLDNIQLDLKGDHWLHWLSQHVPKQKDHRDVTNNFTLDIPLRPKHYSTWSGTGA